jgi:hypothetical protein
VIEKILTHLGLDPQPPSRQDHSTSDRDGRLRPRSLDGAGRRVSTTISGSG